MHVKNCKKLSNGNLLFAQFYSLSPDPTLVTNKEGYIVYVNPAWEKHTGYVLEEVVGKNPRFLASVKTPKGIYKKIWNALLNGKAITTEEVIDKKKDGTEYQIRSKFYPILDNIESTYFIQVIHDITEQKEYENMRKSFLSMAAHELKTPITTLKLLFQIVNNQIGISKKAEHSLIMIDRELDRLTDLIDEMLDLSRVETNKMVITSRPFKLTQLISRILEKFQFLLENHTIIFNHTNEYIASGDEYRIEQVIINLLTNAIKYTPELTIITITVNKKGKKVIVAVKDEGPGIPSQKLLHVFEKFYQVTDKGKLGFGLGLYISSEIVRAHREKLWVESQIGRGTTFYFSLPLVT